MRRILVLSAGLAVAIAANILLVLAAVFFDPVAGGATADLLMNLLDDAFAAQDLSADSGRLALALEALTRGLTAIAVTPLTLSALFALLFRRTGIVWHMLTPGVIAAATPFLLRAAYRQGTGQVTASALEMRFLGLFFLCAALSGALYWLLTQRRASRGG